jgi:hypothetical protein
MNKKKFDDLHDKVSYYYDKIFSGVLTEGDTKANWSKEDDFNLGEMKRIKRDVEKNVQKHFDAPRLKKIKQLTDEAEVLRSAKTLYKKIDTGLEQDPQFPRYKEYLSDLNKIQKELPQNSELKVFEKAKNFIAQTIHRIDDRKREARREVFMSRIRGAEDLLQTSRRSMPSSMREATKKILFLDDVLKNHLISLKGEDLGKKGEKELKHLILEYENTIELFKECGEKSSEK